MKHFIKLFLALILCVTVSSCHGVRPEADEEAVLIMKPWFVGHGGVDMEPVTTGLAWCWWSTSSETFKITPIRYEETLDDIISNENTPPGFQDSDYPPHQEGKESGPPTELRRPLV